MSFVGAEGRAGRPQKVLGSGGPLSRRPIGAAKRSGRNINWGGDELVRKQQTAARIQQISYMLESVKNEYVSKFNYTQRE